MTLSCLAVDAAQAPIEALNDAPSGGHGDDDLYGGNGNDAPDSRDNAAGNDTVNSGNGTDSCHTDPGDPTIGCERH